MLTIVGFFLLVNGLRPGTVGLTLGTVDEALIFLSVLLAPLEAGLDVPFLGSAVFRGTAALPFVEDGLLTLFFGRSVSSALTCSVISSISLAASCSSMVDADNNSATESKIKKYYYLINTTTTIYFVLYIKYYTARKNKFNLNMQKKATQKN